MYTVNEVELDNPDKGWRLLRRTQVVNAVNKNLSSVEIPGRHGVLQGIPAFNAAPTPTLVMRSSGKHLEELYALFSLNGGRGILRVTEDESRAAVFELASMSTEGITAGDELVTVTITLRLPTADWRSTNLIEETITVSGAVTNAELFEGISADIADAGIFVGGNFGNLNLTDIGSGSWIKTVKTWPNIASTGLLINTQTGQAFRATTANPWSPTDDMSEYIDVSGGGGFRITPTWDTDPSDRVAKLKLTVTNSSGVTFKVRALNAFAIRNGDI